MEFGFDVFWLCSFVTAAMISAGPAA